MRRSMNVDIPPVTHSHQSHATHVDGIVAPTLGLWPINVPAKPRLSAQSSSNPMDSLRRMPDIEYMAKLLHLVLL